MRIGKKAADRLVALRLAFYHDEARDFVSPTNSGRYWALNGGYLGFLKEDPPAAARAAAIRKWKLSASPI
ncbi:MAG: hypothetical protein H0T56_07440 [Pseudaminobacter sp.]|nr:hypothetical protein [Pseudaminobacter sp.]